MPFLDEFEIVYLDVGGTMIYLDPLPEEVFRRACASLGIKVSIEDVSKALKRAGEATAPLISTLAVNKEKQDEFWSIYDKTALGYLGYECTDEQTRFIQEYFARAYTHMFHLFPEVLPSLERLKRVSKRLGVISNAGWDLPENLQKLGIYEYFENVTFSFAVGAEKPDERIFRAALEAFAAKPERCAHVGDNYMADVLGAQNAGITPVLIDRDGTQAKEKKVNVIKTLDGLFNL